MHTTIAVLMHFVITPTDPSIAHVNLDLQEMEKTVQVKYSQWYMCSRMAAETLSLLFHSLPLLQLASYSNATTGGDAGEVDWEASHLPFLADLLVCQNSSIGTLFPCYARYRVQKGRKQVFCKCNHFYILSRCMNLLCYRFLFILPQLQRFGDAIGQVI